MRFRVLIIMAALVALGVSASADSLWKPDSKGSLYVSKKAHQAGDLVTILIVESSSSSGKASTSTSKKSGVDAGPGAGPLLKSIPALSLNGNSNSSADGSTTRTASLNARITATVMEVRPNGDLVLEGTRNVTANADTQIIKISGVVRPDDVATDNTVLSTYLADAKIDYSGRGPVTEGNKPGIVTRIFKLLF